MRELAIIVPVNDNDGRPLDALNHAVGVRLLHQFGGFTRVSATGGWLNSRGKPVVEPMVVYTVASSNEEGESRLWTIAEWIADEAGQDAVYIRLLDGTVRLVTGSAVRRRRWA